MTHSPPPGAPRARIPGPRRSPPARRRGRASRWRRRLWYVPAVPVLAALFAYAAENARSLAALLLFAGSLLCAVLALRTPKGHDRDST
ncbi:hypothetical protein ACWD5R_19565 [Streptomyces sp. NPDC002514]|uniref:hypothetical protein n=1 Tax=unclassified Streptomyces TaxID=2593676 RepID=UPI0036CD75C9